MTADTNTYAPGPTATTVRALDGQILTVPQADGGEIQQYAFVPSAPALRPIRTLKGPPLGCPGIVYNPAGDRFVSRGWTSKS